MLEFFSIFSKGGLVLWLFNMSKEDHIKPINNLIRDILLEGKVQNSYCFEKLTLDFKVNNEHDVVFVSGYNSILGLTYVKDLLTKIEQKFIKIHKKDPLFCEYSSFDSTFLEELEMLENINNPILNVEKSTNNMHVLDEQSSENDTQNIPNFTNNESSITSPNQTQVKKRPKKYNAKNKEARVWGDTYNEKDAQYLDFSDNPNLVVKNNKKSNNVIYEKPTSKNLHNLQPNIESLPTESRFFSFFKSLVSGTVITKEKLDPIMNKMKMHLYSKNVAIDICDKICSMVSEKLIGQTIGTFGGISSLVNKVIEEALYNILTPKRDINVMNSILNNNTGRPYVIVFCGVNGVGKSTNLAKIAYHILNNDQRVLIAACDTFRSGAVEQLKTHVSRFNNIFPSTVPTCALFDRGYGRDSAAVAAEAIRIAKAENYNVVLIDTAGRMQNNEPLMRSLAKLIKVNQPDLVLFVGEALVGNDGVDQLREFDRHLIEFSDAEKPQRIDGIVLTKFDAIDDKVGATLSMTYTTGQPIVFVGVGQTYNDLRTLDVKSVVNLLLK